MLIDTISFTLILLSLQASATMRRQTYLACLLACTFIGACLYIRAPHVQDRSLEWTAEYVAAASPKGGAPFARTASAAGAPRPRFAIGFYGLLRTSEETAAYWNRYVADELDADIFYFGPSTWYPGADGNVDPIKDKGVVASRSISRYANVPVAADTIRTLYGDRVKGAWVYKQDFAGFERLLQSVSRRMGVLPISHLFSPGYARRRRASHTRTTFSTGPEATRLSRNIRLEPTRSRTTCSI